MSILKKIAAPLAAVALVAVMGVSLLASTRTAEAATVSTSLSGTVWTTGAVQTTGISSLALTESSATEWTNGDTIILTGTGLTFDVAGCAISGGVCAVPDAANTLTITLTTVTGAVDTATVTFTSIALTAPGAPQSISITRTGGTAPTAAFATGTVAGTIEASRLVLGTAATTTCPAVPNRAAATFSADTNAAGGALCAYLATAAGVAETNATPITFTVSLGVVSTGTAKTTTALTNASGVASTNYRGGGGIASTDTAIASNSSLNLVSTLSLGLTAPTGNTASKLAITAPTQLSVSPTQTNVSPGYVSPTTQTNLSVQVTDSAGLGVNGQVLLVTTDKGSLAQGFGAACGTSKAVTATSASGALTVGGENKAGVVQLTYCGNQTDAAGQATITASNITTSMANVTTTVATGGRPNKVTATYANGSISATVQDANGNNVADGTPVQFTISQNAGAVSNTCTTTTNGKASSAVSLNGTAGSVIVTASYNETGAAAACAGGSSTGSQNVSTVVNIGGATTPGGSTGAGGFATAPVYSASKLAQAVFNGGTVAQLEAAVVAANGSGVWAQTSTGAFVLYIVNGGFVNDAFKAAFPNGFAGVTAVTVVGK